MASFKTRKHDGQVFPDKRNGSPAGDVGAAMAADGARVQAMTNAEREIHDYVQQNVHLTSRQVHAAAMTWARLRPGQRQNLLRTFGMRTMWARKPLTDFPHDAKMIIADSLRSFPPEKPAKDPSLFRPGRQYDMYFHKHNPDKVIYVLKTSPASTNFETIIYGLGPAERRTIKGADELARLTAEYDFAKTITKK